MKIRNGFISNSSTTNFCIYGAALDFEKIENKALDLGCKCKYEEGDRGSRLYEYVKAIKDHFRLNNLHSFVWEEDYDCDNDVMIGADLEEYFEKEENKTPKEIKKETKEILREIFGDIPDYNFKVYSGEADQNAGG